MLFLSKSDGRRSLLRVLGTAGHAGGAAERYGAGQNPPGS
jgi:hypothetical protein